MAKGRKTGGRQKGSQNRVTRTVKETFEQTFKDLQADPNKPHALAKWAQDEPTEFYKLAARLIPTDIKASVTATVKMPGLEVVAAALGVAPSAIAPVDSGGHTPAREQEQGSSAK